MIQSFRVVFVGELRLQLRQMLSVVMLLGLPVVMAGSTALSTAAMADSEAAAEIGKATGLAKKQGEGGKSDKAPEKVYEVWVPPDWWERMSQEPRLELVERKDATAVLAHVVDDDSRMLVVHDLDFASLEAARVLEEIAREHVERDLRDRLGTLPHPDSLIGVRLEDRATDDHKAGATTGTILPVVAMFGLLLAALLTALDVFTGEKERRTIETLLTSRADRRAVAAAKLSVVASATVVTGWLFLLVLAVLQRVFPASAIGDPLSAVDLVALGGIVLLLGPQVAGITSILGIYSDDYKTASMLSAPVMLLVLAPAGVPFLPVELDLFTAAIPIANGALAARELLGGELGVGMALLVAGFSAGHATGAGWVVWRLLDQETALIGSGGVSSSGERRRTGQALAVAALGLVVLWFFAYPAQTLDLLWGMAFSQALFVALALGAIAWLGLPARETLQLRLPTGRDLGLAVVAGIAAPGFGGMVFLLQSLVAPAPVSLFEGLSVLGQEDQSIWVPLLVFALLPAVCEETLFRGAILGLQRSGSRLWPVVLLNAALFGLFHVHFHRWLPTGALGLLVAVAAWKSRSLLVPVVIHLLNNGLALVLTRAEIDTVEPSAGRIGLGMLGAAVAWGMVLSMRGQPEETTQPS